MDSLERHERGEANSCDISLHNCVSYLKMQEPQFVQNLSPCVAVSIRLCMLGGQQNSLSKIYSILQSPEGVFEILAGYIIFFNTTSTNLFAEYKVYLWMILPLCWKDGEDMKWAFIWKAWGQPLWQTFFLWLCSDQSVIFWTQILCCTFSMDVLTNSRSVFDRVKRRIVLTFCPVQGKAGSFPLMLCRCLCSSSKAHFALLLFSFHLV